MMKNNDYETNYLLSLTRIFVKKYFEDEYEKCKIRSDMKLVRFWRMTNWIIAIWCSLYIQSKFNCVWINLKSWISLYIKDFNLTKIKIVNLQWFNTLEVRTFIWFAFQRMFIFECIPKVVASIFPLQGWAIFKRLSVEQNKIVRTKIL